MPARATTRFFRLFRPKLLTSPIPAFIFAGLVALLGAMLKFELEFFMIFYATFFVGYSILAIVRCYIVSPANAIPQVKMFCIGSLAVVIFSFGYFLRYPGFQIFGSLLPVAYVLWLLMKPTASEEFVSDSEELEKPASSSLETRPQSVVNVASPMTVLEPGVVHHTLGGHFEGKWLFIL